MSRQIVPSRRLSAKANKDAPAKKRLPRPYMECQISPFFKLPPELRNIIYDMVLRDDYCHVVPQRILPMSHVCRQIRAETRPLFLRPSHFETWCDPRLGRASRSLETFIYAVIGEHHIHHVQDLVFALDVPWWSAETWSAGLNFESWPIVRVKLMLRSPRQCAFNEGILKNIAKAYETHAVRLGDESIRVKTDDVFGLIDSMQNSARCKFFTSLPR